MSRSDDPLGCNFIFNTITAIFIALGLIMILIAGLKQCRCSNHHSSSPGGTYHQTKADKLYQQRIEEDRKNGRCEHCHGKGTILFSPNSWEGPGYCDLCKKEVKGSHPHICEYCNGTGRQ